jgi:hypothetical protein
MQEEHLFASEHDLHGLGQITHFLFSSKSFPSLQLRQFVEEPEHVLQFESHFKH